MTLHVLTICNWSKNYIQHITVWGWLHISQPQPVILKPFRNIWLWPYSNTTSKKEMECIYHNVLCYIELGFMLCTAKLTCKSHHTTHNVGPQKWWINTRVSFSELLIAGMLNCIVSYFIQLVLMNFNFNYVVPVHNRYYLIELFREQV